LGKNLTDKLNEIKKTLDKAGYDVKFEKSINYGEQYLIYKSLKTHRLRLYETAKGRVTVDISLIGDPDLAGLIANSGEATTGKVAFLSPPLIGSDEAGKGDYFGSLVAAGVYADEETYTRLVGLGVRDSKELSNDSVRRLAAEIFALAPLTFVAALTPLEYNAQHALLPNINVLLARLHARVINALADKSGCLDALADRFTTTDALRRLVEPNGVRLREYPKAEANAVEIGRAHV
jgi:ribonuclease HIII